MTLAKQIEEAKSRLEAEVKLATDKFTKSTGIKVDGIIVDQCVFNCDGVCIETIVRAKLEL